MTPLEAHEKLLALLPSTIHRWEASERNKQGRPPPGETERLHVAILALSREGLTRKEIADKLGVGTATVGRHCRGETWR
jgi:DNA-binding NarL/FixJ family response regulator